MSKLPPQDYNELWKNPANWRFYVFYACSDDPRIIVPKRLRVTGWTMNFAHSEAYLFLAALLALVIVPISLVEVIGLAKIEWIQPATIILSIFAVLVLTVWAGKQRIK